MFLLSKVFFWNEILFLKVRETIKLLVVIEMTLLYAKLRNLTAVYFTWGLCCISSMISSCVPFLNFTAVFLLYDLHKKNMKYIFYNFMNRQNFVRFFFSSSEVIYFCIIILYQQHWPTFIIFPFYFNWQDIPLFLRRITHKKKKKTI